MFSECVSHDFFFNEGKKKKKQNWEVQVIPYASRKSLLAPSTKLALRAHPPLYSSSSHQNLLELLHTIPREHPSRAFIPRAWLLKFTSLGHMPQSMTVYTYRGLGLTKLLSQT